VSEVEVALDDELLPGLEAAGRKAAPSPLFYLEGATEGTTQWRAKTLQVVNWGGFEGVHKVPFHRISNLISGASGSGKSTLLDAYIALMMPSNTEFNGASNDAVKGKARSPQQRNLISYLRGQIDTIPDETGRERPKILRGAGKPTWGAVAMTFIDDRRNTFTALRIWYVPARATVFADVITRLATFAGELDLDDLQPLAQEQFQPRVLKQTFPGLLTHDGPMVFATRLYTQLGIGANGDGAKALKLLVRIQAGRQIETVNDLYRDMVLEEPSTYEDADRAIAHFDDLDASYQAMQTEQEKADLLRPITKKHDGLVAARAVIAQIDTFGLSRTEGNPVELWSRYREVGLLDAEVTQRQAERRTVAENLTTAIGRERRLEVDLKALEDEHRNSGGADLSRLTSSIETATADLEMRRARRSQLAEATDVLNVPLDDAEAYAGVREVAGSFLAKFDERHQELIEEREALKDREFPIADRRRVLEGERRSLEGRASRIRGPLHAMRLQVTEAAGMDLDELPFLAELIDVRAGEDGWRTAIETVLGASARTLLVPEDKLSAFSRVIDPLRLGGRLIFQGVPLDVDAPADPDKSKIAGNLEFKDSRFAGWVKRHVSDSRRNALCVDGPRDLDGVGLRVTRAGQTRKGARGSHGRGDSWNIIGFSSVQALAEIDRELSGLEVELAKIDAIRKDIDNRRHDLEARRKAYEAIMATLWDGIDVDSVERHIRELEGGRNRFLESNDVLAVFEERIKGVRGELDAARETRYRLKGRSEAIDERWKKLVGMQDLAKDEIDRLERDLGIEVTPEQQGALDEYFRQAVGPGNADDVDAYPANLARLKSQLEAHLTQARAAAENAESDLSAIFETYLRRFPDPNLGRSANSYADYAGILEGILTTGLHEQREAWRLKLMQWSGEDLVPLAGAMEACVQEIEERLGPINDILKKLPFGATQDRLQIKLRRTRPESVLQFMRELRALASGATRDLSDEQMHQRFVALQTFMARIRHREDPRWVAGVSDRDALLDVRRHVYVTAERIGPDGTVQANHSSLGNKSGGESQELIAFIVGAALRFRLGDDLRERPRSAPVIIDEGFIKSDSEFAGRAVEAWKGLGFQLIVGAPPDKVSALEPHMDALLLVTKSTKSSYSFVTPAADASSLLSQVAVAELANAGLLDGPLQ
jgi:uncharacterized protein YPO0396